MRKKLIAVLLAAMLISGVSSLAVSAGETVADNAYSVSMDNGNEAGVLAYGRSEAHTLGVLNGKIADINAKVTELNEAGADLAAAYAAGELPVYSRRNNGVITNENNRSSFKNWDGRPVADLKYLNAGYDGWNDESVGWLCYNAKADIGVVVVGMFAIKYENYGKIGVPLADSFIVYDNGSSGDYTAYQNFSNGYFASRNGGDCTVTLTKTVERKSDVAEGASQEDWISIVDVEENAAGYVGAATNQILTNSGITGQQFADLYTNAYARYSALAISVGYAFSNVGSYYESLVAQNFRHGSSVASPWDDSADGDRARWSVLAYNNEQAEVYLIKDEFFYVYEKGTEEHKTAAQKLGAPASEEIVYDGNRYQNFANGYMRANGAAPQNADVAEIVAGKRVTADGKIEDISLKDKVGAVSLGVKLPVGYTRETLGEAFTAAYEVNLKEFELASLDMVTTVNGVILQAYTDRSGDAVALGYDSANDKIRYLSVGAYASFKEAAGLGCPTTDSFKVADGSTTLPAVYAQSFENGYIKIKITTQSDIDENGDIIEYTKEIGTTTIGATYDAEKGVFTTTSYSADITNVADNISDAYDFLEIPEKDALAKMFRDAYDKAFAIGFSAGVPSSEGILWWTTGNSGVIKLTLKGGNGNANFWGDNTIMIYDCDNKVVRISTGAIANIYANDGASGNGWATTEMLVNTKTGTIVQQFNITDKVVTDRSIHIIVPGGDVSKAGKVTGIYDLEANKEGGEWVEYLTQFGGDSISAKPVTVEDSYKKGEAISIDFSKFVNNDASYTVKYELSSTGGSVDAATGAFTITPDAEGDIHVEVIAYTAFDKVTLKVTLKVGGGGAPEPDTSPSGSAKAGCGCGSLGLGGGMMTGGFLLVAFLTVMFLVLYKRRALKNNR